LRVAAPNSRYNGLLKLLHWTRIRRLVFVDFYRQFETLLEGFSRLFPINQPQSVCDFYQNSHSIRRVNTARAISQIKQRLYGSLLLKRGFLISALAALRNLRGNKLTR
jgi:hypothetical protein